MVLATLYFRRRDQRRAALEAALREVKTPANVTGDNYKCEETIDLKKQAETEISLA
jgi:hypothetical protein